MSAPLPPNMSDQPEKPTSRIIRDGVLHNLARKQRIKAEQAQRKSPSQPVPQAAPTVPDDGLPESTIKELTEAIRDRPLKGILKTPKVRFPESAEERDTILPAPPNHHNYFQQYQRSHSPPPPPPHPAANLPGSVPEPPLEYHSGLFSPVQHTLLPHPPPPPPPPETPQPPTLFNLSIEQDEHLNEAAYKLYTKFIDELAEFVSMQGEVIRTRLAVQEKRQELKALREEVANADMLLIDYLREMMASGISSNDPILMQRFDAAQTARDKVGPMELEYEPMEVKLGHAEHQLMDKYSDIESRFEHFFRLDATTTSKQTIPSRIEYEPSSAPSVSGAWTGLDPRDASLFHGTFIGEKVGVGQMPVRAEGHSPEQATNHQRGIETRQPRSSDSPEHSKKKPSNTTPDENPNDQVPESLLGISDAYSTSQDQSFVESQPRDYRISQSLKGIESLAEILGGPEKLPDDEFALDPSLNEGDSLLLRSEDNETRSTLSDYLLSFDSTRDRVNRWMLHQLRVSPREVLALRRLVKECAPLVPNWASLVLTKWDEDAPLWGHTYHRGSVEHDSHDVDEQPQAEVQPFLSTMPQQSSQLSEPISKAPSVSNIALASEGSDIRTRVMSASQEVEMLASSFSST